jgi:hypothetical protein
MNEGVLMHNGMKDIDDNAWHKGRAFQTNNMSKKLGKFHVWVLQGTYLNLRNISVISWVDQIFLEELFSSFVLFEEFVGFFTLELHGRHQKS